MTPFDQSLCLDCEHYIGLRGVRERYVCTAFPDGIPDEILFDGADHTVPWPGDRGIQFKKAHPA